MSLALARTPIFDHRGRVANAGPTRAVYVRPNERTHMFDETRTPESPAAVEAIKAAWPNLKVNFWLRTVRKVYWPHGALRKEFCVEIGLWVVGRKHRRDFLPVGPLGRDGYDYFLIVRDPGMAYRPFDMRVVAELRALTAPNSEIEAENEAVFKSAQTPAKDRRREAIKAILPIFRAIASDETAGTLLKGERIKVLEKVRRKKAEREARQHRPWTLT